MKAGTAREVHDWFDNLADDLTETALEIKGGSRSEIDGWISQAQYTVDRVIAGAEQLRDALEDIAEQCEKEAKGAAVTSAPGDQFNPSQRAEAIALLEGLAWGDMDGLIVGMATCFQRLLEVTADDLEVWESDLGPAAEAEGWDELTLPDELIEGMPPWERLAYIARLVKSLVLLYGLDSEARRCLEPFPDEGPPDSSPAALLHGLNDLLWLPTAEPVKGGRQ